MFVCVCVYVCVFVEMHTKNINYMLTNLKLHGLLGYEKKMYFKNLSNTFILIFFLFLNPVWGSNPAGILDKGHAIKVLILCIN